MAVELALELGRS
uniref:Uncharacterized protein n=1 Tax=Arundo donax TaxID=35708 RepID=A0A0A9B2E0_ARUDO